MPLTALSSNPKVRVFIADDSRIVREHLVTMFDELTAVEIVGQAETVSKAISAIGKLQPDVVILDIRMPDGSGIDVLQPIKMNLQSDFLCPNAPVPSVRRRTRNMMSEFSSGLTSRSLRKDRILWKSNYVLETFWWPRVEGEPGQILQRPTKRVQAPLAQ